MSIADNLGGKKRVKNISYYCMVLPQMWVYSIYSFLVDTVLKSCFRWSSATSTYL